MAIGVETLVGLVILDIAVLTKAGPACENVLSQVKTAYTAYNAYINDGTTPEPDVSLDPKDIVECMGALVILYEESSLIG